MPDEYVTKVPKKIIKLFQIEKLEMAKNELEKISPKNFEKIVFDKIKKYLYNKDRK